jgi:hypothetical protein
MRAFVPRDVLKDAVNTLETKINTTDERNAQTMKTRNVSNCKTNLAAGLAAALAIVWFPITTSAADQMKGGEHLMHLQGIKTQAEADALKPGDTMVMVCAKCKSVVVHNVTTQKGHVKTMTIGEKHLCPGCDSTIKVVGVGHGAHNEIQHVCDKCGSDSAFCCATKPGGPATQGMEKK